MLENQFIQLRKSDLTAAFARPAMPIYIDLTAGGELEIFYDIPTTEVLTEVCVSDQSEQLYCEAVTSQQDGIIKVFGTTGFLRQILTDVSEGEAFVITLNTVSQQGQGDDVFYHSQPLVVVSKDGLSKLRYRCEEDAFGFPFKTVSDEKQEIQYASAIVPINLKAPQYVQEDKTYVKANGEVVTLYAKYYKEWEGETDYLTDEEHQKIVAALSCDEVYINGKRVTKSDKYQVDWENYDIDCDGKTKTAKATFKVRENVTQRNSNF